VTGCHCSPDTQVATKERELKLRAKNKSEYEAWMAALKPVVSDFVDDQDEED
jgi:hypothetical protein